MFLIATGSKYIDYSPFGRGALTRPHKSHAYKYALIGQGRKVGFRLRESFAGDNYGRLRIEIRRARSGDCRTGFGAFGYEDQVQRLAAVDAAQS